MYRLIRFQATNIIGFMSGLGKKNLTIDLSDMQDKSILVVCGDNASGKSTFLSLIHPLHTPSDGRTKFVIPGKEGSLIRSYKGDDGSFLISKCVYMPKPDGSHLAKCYLALQKHPDEDAIELNPNGNVTSYNALLMTYFGITKDYVNFASYSDAVAGIVSMTDGERKANVASLIPNTGRFELAYNTINDKYKELRNLMRNISQKIMSIRDEDSLDSDYKRVAKALTDAQIDRDETLRKLSKIEGRVRELSHGEDIKILVDNYNQMVMSIAQNDSQITQIKRDLYRLYDKLSLGIDTDNDILYTGADPAPRMISKLERKVATAESNIQSASSRLDTLKNSIAKAENEISESESVLFSIQTQDAKELEETKIGYEMQLKELRYTKNKEKYEHMSYDACVALIKAVSTINFMIQSLYDEYNNLVSEYFEQINQDQKALSDKYMESAEWLAIKIEDDERSKDVLYRQIIEKEQYRKFQDILTQRPADCHIDTCPFIANALKWSHISAEIAELKEEYSKICLEIETSEKDFETWKDRMKLMESAQNLITYLHEHEENLKLYLNIDLSSIYKSIANGTWGNLLDVLKLKQLAAILSEKDLYIRITTQLIPDIDRALEIAKVYGSNREMMKNHIEHLMESRNQLVEERDRVSMSLISTSSILSIYKAKLGYWNEINNSLEKYREIIAKNAELTNKATAQEKEITSIRDLVAKCKDLDADLIRLDSMINELSPMKREIEIELAELLKLKAEKTQIDQDFLIVDIMRSLVQPGKGIRKELLNIYFYDIYQTANELLLNTFDGKLRLHEFIITDKEFTIPFEYAGEVGSDVAFASSSQRATIATAISLAIISKLIDRYSIVTFDESDQTLSPANKALFVDILSKQMSLIGISQAFIITHSVEFYESLENVSFIGFPGYKHTGLNTKTNDILEVS